MPLPLQTARLTREATILHLLQRNGEHTIKLSNLRPQLRELVELLDGIGTGPFAHQSEYRLSLQEVLGTTFWWDVRRGRGLAPIDVSAEFRFLPELPLLF